MSQVHGKSTVHRHRPASQPSGVRLLRHHDASTLLSSSCPPTLSPPLSPLPPIQTPHALKPFTHGCLRAGEGGLGLGLGSRAMAMPTVAAAATLHPTISTRRVGVGNGNASATAGRYLAGCWRGAAACACAVRARVADAPPVANESGRQEAPAAPMVEIPVTCYQVNCFSHLPVRELPASRSVALFVY
jgi:hypothetical protein